MCCNVDGWTIPIKESNRSKINLFLCYNKNVYCDSSVSLFTTIIWALFPLKGVLKKLFITIRRWSNGYEIEGVQSSNRNVTVTDWKILGFSRIWSENSGFRILKRKTHTKFYTVFLFLSISSYSLQSTVFGIAKVSCKKEMYKK